MTNLKNRGKTLIFMSRHFNERMTILILHFSPFWCTRNLNWWLSCVKEETTPRILDIPIYFRIRHSFEHLRPVILSADWSISRLQSWTCSSLPTVAEFVKLTQSIVIEIQRQSADLYKVQLCNRHFFVVSTAIYVVKVYERHPLDYTSYQKLKCFPSYLKIINALFEKNNDIRIL